MIVHKNLRRYWQSCVRPSAPSPLSRRRHAERRAEPAADDSLLTDADPDWPHSWYSIRVGSSLPTLSESVVVDGYSQPGALANTLAVGSNAVVRVELSGASAGSNAIGLQATGDGNAIRGLAISRFQGTVALNSGFGIYLNISDGNVVEGNFVGTDVSGMADLGNATDGIFVRGAANNRIGGPTPQARNVISGNKVNGINFFLSSARDNVVQGNYIGTNTAGTGALGNSVNGVAIQGGATFNTIGGVAPGVGNLISANSQDGIAILGLAANNPILGNRIHANSGLGIDLEPNSVTMNDPNDADTGANNRQNFSVLTAASSTATSTAVAGMLNSTPSTDFRVEFFANAAADPTGFGEGQTYLGSIDVTTDAGGSAILAASLPVVVPPGQFLTATATVRRSGTGVPPFGDTSEFSQTRIVDPGATTGEIRGVVWDDRNSNGTRESGEPGVAGWTVYLDDDGDGQHDATERAVVTDGDGNYVFDKLAPGDYEVAQLLNSGWDLISPTTIPEWVYVVQKFGWSRTDVWRHTRFYADTIEIFDFNLIPVASVHHDELTIGDLFDVEIGPGGDIYGGVALGDGRGQIVQFTYSGEFIGVIELPDEELNPDEWEILSPFGFDVLPNGNLLVPRPNSEEILELNPDGSVVTTYNLPGFRPLDKGVLSDGFLYWTDGNRVRFSNYTEYLLNVRYDDLIWVGLGRGPSFATSPEK